MDLKDQVIETLELNKGSYISGSALAERYFVSRNAVWKAVKALKADGHTIEAVTNKGYRLSADSDVLSGASIRKHLGTLAELFDIEVFNTLASTNTALKEQAAGGKPEGMIIAADRQTGGRGRLGREFFSPAGSGVYFSLLLRPKIKAEEATMITAAAAVAVAEAIESVTGYEASIKWVNDIFCRGKKVCGILTEGAFDMESGGMDYVVLGIGVNLTAPDGGFPEALTGVAGTIFEDKKADLEVRSRLIAEILRRFWPFYLKLSAKLFLNPYRALSCVVGQEVDVIAGDAVRRARAIEIDDGCRLVVRYVDGRLETLSSGEVSVKPRAIK